VTEQPLRGNIVRKTWSNGVTFVGRKDASVSWTVNTEGHTQTSSATVTVSGPTTDAEMDRLVRQYASSGRSPELDAQYAGIDELPSTADARPNAGKDNNSSETARSGALTKNDTFKTPNEVYDSDCLTIDKSDAYWHGCFIRKGTRDSDPSAHYLADSSQAAGHAKVGGHWLTAGSTEHRFGEFDRIVHWVPGSDMFSSNCDSVSIGLSAYGASLSRSFTICPKQIAITITNRAFVSKWVGYKGMDTTPGVAAITYTQRFQMDEVRI
jgi:hypothetical protein